jgi:3' terminal RNA ribose 2'-O-methyltransferase Hen1
VLLTITTTHRPATDLGYLLHKHPDRTQSFALPFGQAHVAYPEASDERCTAALLLEVDPVALVRRRRGGNGDGGLLHHYVNDRPYVASSFLAVTLKRVLGTAMAGRCDARPDLAAAALPLEARLAVLRSPEGESLPRRLFEPLGYTVEAERHPLDERFPAWGPSDHLTLTLRGRRRLAELLTHLYVLVPVLDDEKHYWIGDEEVDKLLRHGDEWLAAHPERELIAGRYLKHQRGLTREALARLLEDVEADPDSAEAARDRREEAVEAPLGLGRLRVEAVVRELLASGAKRVLDLGCGEGRLLAALQREPWFQELVGVDVSLRALEVAGARLGLERLPPERRRVRLLHGALTYRDRRLGGYDAAAVVEVIEHLEPSRLGAFERVAFEHVRPATVVVTTPNAEYNARFEGLPAGAMRHPDHRFEWSRAEFAAWARGVAGRFGYALRLEGIGPEDPALGPPTQMAVFSR